MARGGWFRRHVRNGTPEAKVPEGLWNKCPKCGEIVFAKDIERNLYVCLKCDHHQRLTWQQRLAMTVDEGSFEETDAAIFSIDPLKFPNYAEKTAKYEADTGLRDGVVTGRATLDGYPLLLGISDFRFNGGSMGSVAGEKIVRIMERGVEERLPVVLFTASGGARMQEGLLSLMQMAKTSAATKQLDVAAVPYVVVLTDPTMAGVYASYASLGDILLAEPGAILGFAGRRVGNQDMGMKLPDDFQTSEFQFRCGMIDQVVPRKELRGVLAQILAFFAQERADAK